VNKLFTETRKTKQNVPGMVAPWLLLTPPAGPDYAMLNTALLDNAFN
jgi:hypothetical protein